MMFKIKKLFFIILMFWGGNSEATNTLDQQIKTFLVNQTTHKMHNIVIRYISPKPVLNCTHPVLSLTNEKKLWGKVMLIAQCGTNKHIIQLNIAGVGNYVIAARPIKAGSTISADDMLYKSGRLDKLPDSLILDKQEIIDHVALRNIHENQSIKTTMIRKKWLVTAGQSSRVIIRGNGYQIVTNGKALSNARLNDPVNIRIDGSGRIINGLATNEGILVFNKN